MKLAAAPRLFLLTALAMTAFAANSILCRVAVRGGHIDPAAFTTVRLVSGAFALWLMVKLGVRGRIGGDWGSALALAVYAAAFSFAYLSLTAGMGALLLFGAVQASMLVAGLMGGERFRPLQGGGFVLAVAGLVWLVLPGIAAPPLLGAALMLAAGVAWGLVFPARPGREHAGSSPPPATSCGRHRWWCWRACPTCRAWMWIPRASDTRSRPGCWTRVSVTSSGTRPCAASPPPAPPWCNSVRRCWQPWAGCYCWERISHHDWWSHRWLSWAE